LDARPQLRCGLGSLIVATAGERGGAGRDEQGRGTDAESLHDG